MIGHMAAAVDAGAADCNMFCCVDPSERVGFVVLNLKAWKSARRQKVGVVVRDLSVVQKRVLVDTASVLLDALPRVGPMLNAEPDSERTSCRSRANLRHRCPSYHTSYC